MSIQDIFRAAQRANGVPADKLTSPPPSNTPPLEQCKPKWYEKTWLIALLIFFVFPIGLIWLWAVGRYSRNVKIGVTVIVAFLAFIGQTSNNSADAPVSNSAKSTYTRSTVTEKTIYASSEKSCTCIANAEDIDDFLAAAKRKDLAFINDMRVSGRTFVIKSNTRVLCSDSGIYKDVVFVTFLEGEHEGKSAYVPASRVK